MRLRLLFSIWTAIALLSTAACEFHAEAGTPPATPSSTPAPTTAPAPATPTPATPAATPTSTGGGLHTGHVVLQHSDAGI